MHECYTCISFEILEPHGSRLCDGVSLKFLQGVAYGCWLLDFSYVCDSLSAGCLLPEVRLTSSFQYTCTI